MITIAVQDAGFSYPNGLALTFYPWKSSDTGFRLTYLKEDGYAWLFAIRYSWNVKRLFTRYQTRTADEYRTGLEAAADWDTTASDLLAKLNVAEAK